MKLLFIDTFDSFTYNLVQFLGELGACVEVYRNDALTPKQVVEKKPEAIVVSPGPGGPMDAGISKEVIRLAAGKIPVLGVCLGHQCIAEVFGCRICRTHPVHGKTTVLHHDGKGIFRDIPNPCETARYHSLAVDPKSIQDDIVVTAETDDGVIMGIRHKRFPIEGIQFHPESFMTLHGKAMLANLLRGGLER